MSSFIEFQARPWLTFLDPRVGAQTSHAKLGHDLFCGMPDPYPFSVSNDWMRMIWTRNVTSIFFKALDSLKNMKDEELLDAISLADLKTLKALGIINQERFDAVVKLSVEKFRKENDTAAFSLILKKEPLERLLEIYTFDELKAKFDAEFSSQDVHQIMYQVGLELFFSEMGRELVCYDRFESLGTVKLHEVLGLTDREITFAFEKNKVSYESLEKTSDATHKFSKTCTWEIL